MSIAIAGWEMREMLRAVSFAAAPTGEDRPQLQGIRLRAFDGRLHVAATDGHRIARTSRPVTGDGFPTLTLALGEVAGLYEACRSKTGVILDGAPGGFTLTGGRPGTQSRFARTAHDDDFPTSYEHVIPTTWDAEVHIEVGQFVRVVYQLAAGWLFQSPGLLRLQKGKAGLLEVAPLRGFGGVQARVGTCPAHWPDGPWPDRGINALYLLDAMTAAPGPAAFIRMRRDPSQPIAVFSPGDPAWVCITMPVSDADYLRASHRTLH